MFSYLKNFSVIGQLSVLFLAQILFVISTGYGKAGIQLNLDAAQFQSADKSPYLEIYYSSWMPKKLIISV